MGRPKGSKNKPKAWQPEGYKPYRRPAGNDVMRGHRMLRTRRPDLLARVLANELTIHAAMLEAGFRHRTLTVPADDMYALACVLRRRLDAEQLEELAYWVSLDAEDWQEESRQEKASRQEGHSPEAAHVHV